MTHRIEIDSKHTAVWAMPVEGIPRLAGLAETFYMFGMDGAENAHDGEAWAQIWSDLMSSGDAVILYSTGTDDPEDTPVGMLGGTVGTSLVDGRGDLCESFWYVDPDHRGVGVARLAAFEQVGEYLGVSRIYMASLSGVRPKAFERLYKSRGYEATDVVYVKRLGELNAGG